jgi:hypothetical protein
MDRKGIILKQDVDQIWRNKKYSKFRKEKDYLLAVMTHLDILVEPKRYDSYSHSRIPTDFYYVASMIRKLDNTGYLESSDFSQRNIAIVFDMNDTIIPPALSDIKQSRILDARSLMINAFSLACTRRTMICSSSH